MEVFIFIIILFLIVVTVVSKSENVRIKQEKEKKDKENKELFNLKKVEFNISDNHMKVNYQDGFAKLSKCKQYIWVENYNLCFFPAETLNEKDKYILYKIPLKNIEYYFTRGKISKETKISGGGGELGGSSIKGALVGGVIAGGAGAVIGSRKKGKIEPIKTQIITNDNRETFLNYYIDNVKHSIFLNYRDYSTLLKIIPKKRF